MNDPYVVFCSKCGGFHFANLRWTNITPSSVTRWLSCTNCGGMNSDTLRQNEWVKVVYPHKTGEKK